MRCVGAALSARLDKLAFLVLFTLVFASRTLVISQVIESTFATIAVQLLYVGVMAVLWLADFCKGSYRPSLFSVVVALLCLHVVLFCYVLKNPAMPASLGIGQTMGLFLLVVVLTGWFVRSRSCAGEFASLCFYTLGAILLLQMLTHTADVNLAGLGSLFSADERTRTVFGFGHPNTLGGMCVALWMMWACKAVLTDGQPGIASKMLDYVFLTTSVVMLLCSASRSSLIGLVLFLSLWATSRLSLGSKYAKLASRASAAVLVLAAAYILASIFGSMSTDALVGQSNRLTLFDHALPALFESGRFFIGLGYVSNSAYGEGLTPYNTLWLDNSYVYYLVATGLSGLLIIILALIALFGGALRATRADGMHGFVVASMAAYLFIGFFEVVVLTGNPMNYFLI